MSTTAQQATLVAAMDRIIPADDFPSASQANVGVFIARMMATDLRHRADDLAEFLDAIDATATAALGRPFVALSAAAQDDVLRETEDDPKSRAMFHWLVALVQEGYYADPGNGGNRDAVSWTMLGYDPKVPGYDGGIEAGKRLAEEFSGGSR